MGYICHLNPPLLGLQLLSLSTTEPWSLEHAVLDPQQLISHPMLLMDEGAQASAKKMCLLLIQWRSRARFLQIVSGGGGRPKTKHGVIASYLSQGQDGSDGPAWAQSEVDSLSGFGAPRDGSGSRKTEQGSARRVSALQDRSGLLIGTNPALKKPSNIPEIYAKMFGSFH